MAWELVREHSVKLVDVRTVEERKFVGHVPGSLHMAWQTGLSLTRNPRFLRELEHAAGKEAAILLHCPSGKGSAAADATAARPGLLLVFNAAEGFLGGLDDKQR